MSEKSENHKSQTDEEQSNYSMNGHDDQIQQPEIKASPQYEQIYNIIMNSDLSGLNKELKQLEDNNILSKVLNERDQNYKQTLIYHLAQSQSYDFALEAIQIFHQKGAQITINDFLGQSPFFYATNAGNIKLLKYFLSLDIDINETDHYRQTPLFYAARNGKVDVAQVFVDYQANLNHKDLIQQTPLFYAAREGKLQMCDFLIKNGANINEVDLKKQTPLYYAKKFKQEAINDFLIDNGAIDTKDGRLTKTNKSKLKKSIKDDKSHNNFSKKKKHKYKETQKFAYKLCFSQSPDETNPLNKDQFKKFREEYPYIAKILLHQEIALSSKEIMTKLNEKSWKISANQIVQQLWKAKGGKFFHEPVDPIALEIPSYFEIIQKPMDFGTIKKKLSYNIYKNFEEFQDDMNQVFINCEKFNGTTVGVGKIGVELKKKFDELVAEYKSNRKSQNLNFNFEEFLKQEIKNIKLKDEERKQQMKNDLQPSTNIQNNQF